MQKKYCITTFIPFYMDCARYGNINLKNSLKFLLSALNMSCFLCDTKSVSYLKVQGISKWTAGFQNGITRQR